MYFLMNGVGDNLRNVSLRATLRRRNFMPHREIASLAYGLLAMTNEATYAF
jgi:hypothetical protein